MPINSLTRSYTVPYRGPPRYNPKRRSGINWLGANGCTIGSVGGGNGSGNSSLMSTLTRSSASCGHHGPPSPCPSEHMPYSSASSSLSEGSSGHRSHEDDISIVTDKSLGDTSDIISDSSGIGTNSDSAACSIGHPSTTVVCMESYSSNQAGHIRLQQGDVIEVVGSTDSGMLEGYVRGTHQSGFFPANVVQEVNLRQKHIMNVSTGSGNQSPYQHVGATNNARVQGSPQLSVGEGSISNGNTLPRQNLNVQQSPSLSINSNCSAPAHTESDKLKNNNNNNFIGHYNSSTAPRQKKSNYAFCASTFNEPRTVVLHRAKRGFGFILRGAKAASPLMQLKPSERFPALQYLDDVDPGGVADMAGLKPGDFLLAIGGQDVRAASHEQVVEMIRSAGSLVSITVISPRFPNQMQATPQYLANSGQHLSSGPNTPQSAHRQCATLPRKMSLGPGSRQPAPMPPRRDPKTTLSVGRARAKSMVAGLENGGEKDDDGLPHTKSSSVESIVTPTPTHPGTPVQLRTASIKARPTSSRITAAELEELFQRQQGEAVDGSSRYSTMMTTSRFQSGTDSGAATPPASNGSPLKAPLVYGSVAEMKRKTKTKNNGTLRGKPCAIPTIGGAGVHDLKRFHSTPDLNTNAAGSSSSIWAANGAKTHHSQDDVATLHASMQRLNTGTNFDNKTTAVLPPPSHPPPPPPVGQVVKVETRNSSEYESTLSLQQKLKKRAENDAVTSAAIDGIQSSFNPSANAKIYASPQELRNVMAWKMRQNQENRQNGAQPQQAVNNSQQQTSNANIPPPPPPMQENGQQQTIKSQSPYAQPTMSNNNNNNNNNNGKQSSPYAAPQPQQPQQQQSQQQQSQQQNCIQVNAPPIPDPDYSLSESDDEDENSILVARNTKLNEKIALIDVPETSSQNSSGSSSGSASITHSLSVDEIQRVRSNLKTSKSSPNGFLKAESKKHEEKKDTPAQNKANKNNNINNNNNDEVDAAADEEGDNSSSGVSSDQEVAAAASASASATIGNRPTDTIKKKPSVTIMEHPKTFIPSQSSSTEDEDTAKEVSQLASTPKTENQSTPPQTPTCNTLGLNIKTESILKQTEANKKKPEGATPAKLIKIKSTATTTTAAADNKTTVIITAAAAAQTPSIKTTTSVASTAAAFEAKSATATTVTVKQMVQQQHAPVIQQQQQQMSSATSHKVKTLLVQSQQLSTKPNMVATRLTAQQNVPNVANQKLQQLAHQQHLQQLLKTKSSNNMVTKSQLSVDVDYDERRSDDEGDLSPSPPAKGFQRHNSLTRKQAAAIAMQRATRQTAAVSLVQLPPPLETDSDHEMNALSVAAHVAAATVGTKTIVLPPPPQFCDCNDIKQVSPQLQQQHQQQQQQLQQQQQQQQQMLAHQQQQQQQQIYILQKHQQHQQQQHQQQQQQQQQQAHATHHHHHHHHVQHAQQQQQQQHQLLQQHQQQQLLQQHHAQLAQQQLQQQHHLQQQQQQQQQHAHTLHVAGSGVGGVGGVGSAATLGRVRVVGTMPKTNHHRLH